MTNLKHHSDKLPFRVTSFSLQSLVVFVSYIPIAVGAAMAIHFEVWYQALDAFGAAWELDLQEALFRAVGVSGTAPGWLWCMLAIGRIPSWICFSLLTFILAYVNSRALQLFAVVFLLSAPIGVATFIHEMLFQDLFRETVLLLAGAIVSYLAYGCAILLRRIQRFPEQQTSIFYLEVLIIATLVCLSARGWYLFSFT